MLIEYRIKNLSFKEYTACNQLIETLREAEEDKEDTNMDEQEYYDTPSEVKDSQYTKTPIADWKLTGLTFDERRVALAAVAAFRQSRRRRVVTFTETGECINPTTGQYYLNDEEFRLAQRNISYPYPIYTRTESFIEKEIK